MNHMYGIKSRRTGRSEPSTYLIYHSCCRRLLVNSPTWVKPGIQFGIQVACKNQEFWVSRLPVLVFWTRAHLRQLHLQIEIGAGMQKTKILGILILGNWFLALGHRKESSAAAAANENATQYRNRKERPTQHQERPYYSDLHFFMRPSPQCQSRFQSKSALQPDR